MEGCHPEPFGFAQGKLREGCALSVRTADRSCGFPGPTDKHPMQNDSMQAIPSFDVTEYKTLLGSVVSGLGLRLSERQVEQLATHFSLLVHWNRKINLTSVRRPEDIAVRHFEESLFLTKIMTLESGLLVDVGSGAGFPGVPVKIACPAMTAVLLEPSTKKTAFLKEVIRHCKLEGIEVRSERLEAAARGELAGRAALVTLRAVALTADLLADLKKLLAPEGRLGLV